jgi:hypothetical protein
VPGADTLRVTLATPSAAELRAETCGAAEDGAWGRAARTVIGVVRDADTGRPVRGASVRAQWTRFALGAGAVGGRAEWRETRSDDDGRFRLCGLPPGDRPPSPSGWCRPGRPAGGEANGSGGAGGARRIDAAPPRAVRLPDLGRPLLGLPLTTPLGPPTLPEPRVR